MALNKQERAEALIHTLVLSVLAQTDKEKKELTQAALKLMNSLPEATVERCQQLAEMKLFERRGKLLFIQVGNESTVH